MGGKAIAGTPVEDQWVLAAEAEEEQGVDLVGRAAWPAGEVAIEEWAPSGLRVDAVEAVAESIAQVRAAAERKGIEVAYAYAVQPVWVQAGQEELREALDVILNAAVESADTGSIAVRCTEREGEAVLDIAVMPDPGSTGMDLDAAFPQAADATGDDLASIWSLVEAQRTCAATGVLSPENADHVTVRLQLAQG